MNLADCYALSGERERAEIYYRKIVEKHAQAQKPIDLKSLSQAYAHLGLHAEAIGLLSDIETSGERHEQAFNKALVFAITSQHLAALAAVETALAGGFGAVWFTLPWFDRLCTEPSFSDVLGNHGLHDRCSQVVYQALGATID